ncbi:transposase (plasmid) [Rhizobium sp. CCGE 510]|nr:transposase [Rhizobium sp. CCGE 510]
MIRFPAEVIAHAVWLYFRFPLSLRMVEDMLAAAGSLSRIKRSDRGRRSSAEPSPTTYAVVRSERLVTTRGAQNPAALLGWIRSL